MSNSNIVLVAGSVDLNDGVNTFLVGARVGAPLREREQLGGPGVDIAAAGAVDESAWVESTFRVAVAGADVDEVMARVDAIAAELRAAADWTIGLRGSAYTGRLRVKLGQCVEVPLEYPWDVRLMNAARTQVEVSILREPWVYGATSTLYSQQAVSIPCVLDLSGMTGDVPAPLKLLIDGGAAGPHQLVAGVYPQSPVPATKFFIRAVGLSWTGGQAAADTSGYPDGTGNTVWRTSSKTGVYAQIDVTDYAPGTYAVFANAKRDAGCESALVEVYAGDYRPVAIESTQLRRHLLGVVSLPTRRVRGAATSTLTVGLRADDLYYAALNTIELVPCHAGLIGWHHPVDSVAAQKLGWEDGLVYADDVASPAHALGGRDLRARGGTLVVIGEKTSAAPTMSAAVSVEYDPRWEQLPSA